MWMGKKARNLNGANACVFILSLMLFFESAPVFASECNTLRAKDQTRPIRITYFHPYNHDASFWYLHEALTRSVARQFGIDLQSVPIPPEQRNRFEYKKLVESYLDVEQKPDAVLGIFYANGESNLLTLFERYQVPFFSINTSLDSATLARLNMPRQAYPQWIGHMAPGDYEAGFALATALFETATNLRPNIVAIAGSAQSAVSNNRVAGFESAVLQKRFRLIPTFATNWTKVEGAQMMERIFARIPDIDYVWTAGPDLASGAYETIAQHQQNNKPAIKIGTFDWSADVVEMLENRRIHVSYGGHFSEGAWALIALVDYLNGIDFADDIGTLVQTHLAPLTTNNVAAYAAFVREKKWLTTDFKSLSKCFSPTRKTYNFKIEQLLQ